MRRPLNPAARRRAATARALPLPAAWRPGPAAAPIRSPSLTCAPCRQRRGGRVRQRGSVRRGAWAPPCRSRAAAAGSPVLVVRRAGRAARVERPAGDLARGLGEALHGGCCGARGGLGTSGGTEGRPAGLGSACLVGAAYVPCCASHGPWRPFPGFCAFPRIIDLRDPAIGQPLRPLRSPYSSHALGPAPCGACRRCKPLYGSQHRVLV